MFGKTILATAFLVGSSFAAQPPPAFTSAVQLQKPDGWPGSGVIGRSVSASAGYAAAGSVFIPNVTLRTVRWAPDGSFSYLGEVPGQTRSVVWAIADDGQVAGRVTVSGSDTFRAARWAADGTGTLLGELPGPTTIESTAYAINEYGRAVGQVRMAGLGSRAVAWTPDGSAALLGDAPGRTSESSGALAINAAGDAVGNSYRLDSGNRAVRWNRDGSAVLLGEFPGLTWSIAYGISDGGMVVGNANSITLGQEHAVRWTPDGPATLLGDVPGHTTLKSHGLSVLDSGLAVGYANLAGTGERAVLWDAAGNASLVQDLMADGNSWLFTQARGVDADAQTLRVLVYGFKNGGPGEYYLIEAPIPEPSAATLTALVLSALLPRRATRHRQCYPGARRPPHPVIPRRTSPAVRRTSR